MSLDTHRRLIEIYTDGACEVKTRNGGWAAVVVEKGKIQAEISGGQAKTTNNAMEMAAAQNALILARKRYKGEEISLVIISDSKYLINGATTWVKGWKRNGWKTKTGAVKNRPLWENLYRLLYNADNQVQYPFNIHWRWVKGHNGNKFNERADDLAVMERNRVKPRKEKQQGVLNEMQEDYALEEPELLNPDKTPKKPAVEENPLDLFLSELQTLNKQLRWIRKFLKDNT